MTILHAALSVISYAIQLRLSRGLYRRRERAFRAHRTRDAIKLPVERSRAPAQAICRQITSLRTRFAGIAVPRSFGRHKERRASFPGGLYRDHRGRRVVKRGPSTFASIMQAEVWPEKAGAIFSSMNRRSFSIAAARPRRVRLIGTFRL
jgi:hypothetical protein